MTRAVHIPSIIVLRCGDSSASENGLVFHKVLFAAGEDRAVGDKQILHHLRVGDDDEELIAHEDGEKWTILLRPLVQGSFRVFAKEGVPEKRPRRYRVTLCVFDVLANEKG